MIVREMSEEDLAEVAVIEQESFSLPWKEEDFRKAINNADNQYLVAELNHKVIGYCGYWEITDEGDIYNVAVDKEHRGQKIGYHMLKALIQVALCRGITSLTLEVRSSNVVARRLYESLGFQQEGIRKGFYAKPKDDAVIMWLKPIQ